MLLLSTYVPGGSRVCFTGVARAFLPRTTYDRSSLPRHSLCASQRYCLDQVLRIPACHDSFQRRHLPHAHAAGTAATRHYRRPALLAAALQTGGQGRARTGCAPRAAAGPSPSSTTAARTTPRFSTACFRWYISAQQRQTQRVKTYLIVPISLYRLASSTIFETERCGQTLPTAAFGNVWTYCGKAGEITLRRLFPSSRSLRWLLAAETRRMRWRWR